MASTHRFVVTQEQSGKRIDQVLVEVLPEYSRARLSAWIKSGQAQLDEQTVLPKQKVKSGQLITLEIQPEAVTHYAPEPMDIPIVFEDEHIIIVNKPRDLVVHPAAGNLSGTLLNGLLHHCPALEALPRAGIVHRLDKGTTGLMVVAKTLRAHATLAKRIHDRQVKRCYRALVFGKLNPLSGFVEQPVGRHVRERTKMAVTSGGKYAKTHYEVLETLDGISYIGCQLETGRTHQIRVHMAFLGHPLVGDAEYRGRPIYPKGYTETDKAALDAFDRPALHAHTLAFEHPVEARRYSFTEDLPEDFAELLRYLQSRLCS